MAERSARERIRETMYGREPIGGDLQVGVRVRDLIELLREHERLETLTGPDSDERDALITDPLVSAIQAERARAALAERELRDRELHHFEEEQARAAAEAKLAQIAEARQRWLEDRTATGQVLADDLHGILNGATHV